MNSPFKVGDRVVIVNAPLRPERLGAITTVTSALRPAKSGAVGVEPGSMVHEISFPPRPGFARAIARPCDLRKYEPDDREPIAWTDELERLCRGRVKA